jgi:hypothetical protein
MKEKKSGREGKPAGAKTVYLGAGANYYFGGRKKLNRKPSRRHSARANITLQPMCADRLSTKVGRYHINKKTRKATRKSGFCREKGREERRKATMQAGEN